MARSTRPWSSASAARCSPCDEAAPAAGARHLDALRRGLVPHRPKDLSLGTRSINARAETVAERPGFRDAFGGQIYKVLRFSGGAVAKAAGNGWRRLRHGDGIGSG